ncbi:MAG: CHASE2 domain-containing protein [Actinobacteria bacterium]|nr:CHASE2 domain-containing protein [Actinomycetota bacterium]
MFATTEVNEDGEPKFVGVAQGSIEYARTAVGNANFETDPGGIIRRLAYGIDRLPSFAVTAAERVSGQRVESFDADDAWVDYFGPAGTIPTYPLARVAKGDFKRGTFRDRIVVVGASAPSLQDLHPVSFGNEEMPGPEIQANAIATVLKGLPLSSVPGWLNLILVIVLGMLSPIRRLATQSPGTLRVRLPVRGARDVLRRSDRRALSARRFRAGARP